MKESDIIKTQLIRNVRGISKISLVLLEEVHQQLKILEELLLKIGITKYEDSNFHYNKDRKIVLDRMGEAERELVALINSFEIHLKRDE